MSHVINGKQIPEKSSYEDSSILSNSTNTSFSENFIQDINFLKSKEIYLISKTFEAKIPELLSYLQNDSNIISNKLLIIRYLINLFTKVDFNSEIFSYKYSNNDKEKLNLFQIIINQFINCSSEKEDYLRELKGLFTLLISQITLDKETYQYIFTFIINYINKLNNNGYLNNDIQDNNSVTISEQLSRALQLLQIYYQSIQIVDEPYNYFYFNGKSDNCITILNRENPKTNKKILNLEESLNILMFIKLVPSQIVKQVYQNINHEILDILFNVKNYTISIGIDKDNYLTTNFTSEKLIQLKEGKIFSLLLKFNIKDAIKVDIFINNEKVEISKDIIIQEKVKKIPSKEKLEIKEIQFFKSFIGICSNIIIYKESEKEKKNEGLPKFFIVPQQGRGDSKEKFILKSAYLNGFYKEELFSVFIKQELKDKIDEKIIKEINFPFKDKSGENDIKEFLEKNLISIYMPNRIVPSDNQINKTFQTSNKLILKDSINYLDAEFNINSQCLNGVHIFSRFYEDFTPYGGLNHFLPIIEIMSQNKDLLLEENLANFFNLISSIFMPSYLNALKNENNSNFFFTLSYFLEKIPNSYFDNQIACKLISLSSFLVYLNKNYLNLIIQFHNYILLNKNILFKFNYDDQAIILEQIKYYIDCSQREQFTIDTMLIIDILMHYDKEKYNKFCCQSHSECFNESCEVHEPELLVLLKPVEEIIAKLFEKFVKEASQCKTKECETGPKLFKIFEMLTIDISPCLQKIIINQFLNYMKNHFGKYFAFLDKGRRMLDIALFIFKTSIFDVKIDALNLILFMNKIQENMDDFYANRCRTNSWAFTNENEINIIDQDKEILIQNYILPFYLLGEGILVSSSSTSSSKNDNLNESMIIDIDKNKDNKNPKRYLTDKNMMKLAKNYKKLNKSSMHKMNSFDSENLDFNKSLTFNENNNFEINQNGAHFTYIKITTIQQKIYLNYKKNKINDLILGLYKNIFNSFTNKVGYSFILNLLVKIVSKSDIFLINKFLNDLKKKSESKGWQKQICDNRQLFHWLLETSFQVYMQIESKNNKKTFTPGFCIEPSDEYLDEELPLFTETENIIKIEDIFKKANELIGFILKKNIYKLDYILTWSKYYYEMRNDKNNFEHVRDYTLKIIRTSYKLSQELLFQDIKINDSIKEAIYFLNIIFELITFYKLNGAQDNKVKELSQIDEELSRNFPYMLLLEINNENNVLDEYNIMKTLNIKWNDFPFYEKIYSFFRPLWIGLSEKKKKDDKDINITFKKFLGKKNAFINELELLFYSFKDNQENKDSQLMALISNKGIKVIIMIFHFFILLFNIGGNEKEIKNIYNDFCLFIILLIISSSSVTTTSDIKNQKWPNEKQYKEIQEVTQLILCYTLNFFINKINEVDILIKKYNKSSKNNETKDLIKYYIYLRKILIENLGLILKALNSIYKESNGKLFSKMKNFVIKSGAYLLSEKLYSFIEIKENDNLDSSQIHENFLDNILKLNIKRDSKEINSEFEKNINLFINSTNIKNYLSGIVNEPKNKIRLYPFGKYIEKRERMIKSIIPIYDNRENAHEPQKNLCLVPHYWQECFYDKILDIKVGKINKEVAKEIFINTKKKSLEENEKINEYKKIKKKLFSFNGIWSKEEFFYESKYHLKYKLVNHLTEDFSRILLTPILDLDYYLPTFSNFNNMNLFRSPEKQVPIYYLADLSFALKENKKSFLKKATPEDNNKNNNQFNESETKQSEDKNNNSQTNKEENSQINKNNQVEQVNINSNEIRKSKKLSKKRLNALFDIKLANYSFFNNSKSTEQNFSEPILFSEFMNQKHLLNSTKYNKKVNACLIKTELHISGIFYNNSEEVGFYHKDKNHSNEEEDYDFDRNVCFGSIFKPQINKYNSYYLKIPYTSIEFVLKRKYYFKKSVLEIFTINKKSYSFQFEEKDMKDIFDNIHYFMKADIEDISTEFTKYEDKIGFYNKKKILNGIQLPNKLKNMNLKYLYEKWMKWEISTFKFLMILNFYANRSYNDINQYPVFPWILTDYSSDNFPSEIPIRPMGVPMGMMEITKESKERKESYRIGWESGENEEEKEEDYDRYKSHYSASLYITYYMVRVFPFSSMRIELQGKNFDDPNRLFNSLPDSFYCAMTQKSDIRELVPEIFALPEMFYNFNKLNLGNIKNKNTNKEIPVNDILIPRWANNDGYIFIHKHRMLLESPEINEKINEWFNIIFGSKQNGKEAKKIGNQFIRQSYENFDEIYNKSDKTEKIYYCRMVEFGVTPHQILKNEAYKKINYNDLKCKRSLFPNITEIVKKNEEKVIEIYKEIEIENENRKSKSLIQNIIPIKIFLHQKNDEGGEKRKIYVFNEGGLIKIIKNQNQFNQPAASRRIISSKNLHYEFNIEDKIQIESKIKKSLKSQNSKKEVNLLIPKYRINSIKIPNVFFNKGHCIALGGFWNGDILVETITSQSKKDKNEKNGFIETKIYNTKENSPITHLIFDEKEIYAICANILGTIFVFTINQTDKTDWHLYKVVYGHFSPITSLFISENLNTFISCSKTGYCMLYTLPNYKLVNSFKLKNIINNSINNENLSIYADIALISSSPLPCIIFYFRLRKSLALISINGHFIKEQTIDFDIIENGIKIFTDRQFIDYLIIFNQKNESIEIYNIIDLKLILNWPIKNYIFIDFTFSKELDSIFVLVNCKTKIEKKNKEDENSNYKILVLK